MNIDIRFPDGAIPPTQHEWAGRIVVNGRRLRDRGRRELVALARDLDIDLPDGTPKPGAVAIIAARLQLDRITADARAMAGGEVA